MPPYTRRVRKVELSESIQDYLKAIYKLQGGEGRVPGDRARAEQDVAAGSASEMVKKLAALGLADNVPYRASAHPRGRARRARGDPPPPAARALPRADARPVVEAVHDEADRLEHVLSDELEARIDRRWASRRSTRTATRSRREAGVSRSETIGRRTSARAARAAPRARTAAPSRRPVCSETPRRRRAPRSPGRARPPARSPRTRSRRPRLVARPVLRVDGTADGPHRPGLPLDPDHDALGVPRVVHAVDDALREPGPGCRTRFIRARLQSPRIVRLSDLLRNPFSFLFARSSKEDRVAAYVVREHERGRAVDEILEDPYVRTGHAAAVARLLERPEVIHALGEATAWPARARARARGRPRGRGPARARRARRRRPTRRARST